jgi:DNA-binding LacI/PurR family transcriptional regulator
MAAQMLLDRIDGEMTSDEIVISQRLVVRASAP